MCEDSVGKERRRKSVIMYLRASANLGISIEQLTVDDLG